MFMRENYIQSWTQGMIDTKIMSTLSYDASSPNPTLDQCSILVEFTGNLNKKSIMLILKRISNYKSEKILPIVNL
jgi:hypothetical protein